MADQQQQTPVIVRDPRYVAGRQTIGQPSSIDIFALLLEEAQSKYGHEHLETAPAFYEYGNALFRVVHLQQQQQQAADDEDEEESKPQQQPQSGACTGAPATTAASSREAAALAAERRAKQQAGSSHADEDDKKPPAVTTAAAKQETNGQSNDESTEEDGSVGKDLLLALEMMENAYAILDGARDNDNSDHALAVTKYSAWIRDQVPRVLTGLGDVLSALRRHADALDAYLRALEHRQEILRDALSAAAQQPQQQQPQQPSNSAAAVGDSRDANNNSNNRLQVQELLPCRRRVVEAHTLIVEELLACDLAKDVVTTETKAVLVPAGKGVEYATGYYEKAREELQETVLLMGQLQADGHDLGEEKENVCFAATLVMAAGEALAAIDESTASLTVKNETEPKKKKAKA